MSLDITIMSDEQVMVRMISAKNYRNAIALKYWKDVWRFKNDETGLLTVPDAPRSTAAKRRQGFHTNYIDERTISNEVIMQRIENANAWNDSFHAERWGRIIDKRIK